VASPIKQKALWLATLAATAGALSPLATSDVATGVAGQPGPVFMPDWPRVAPKPVIPSQSASRKTDSPPIDPATGEPILDPLFPKQYQLHYDGRTIDGFRGWPHLNTNLVPAWAITKGAGVKVGVMDNGIEPHSDLPPFTAFSSPLLGYAPDRSQSQADHGMAVAGIMVAQHNAIGMRGVAPDAELFVAKWGAVSNATGASVHNAQAFQWFREQGVGVVNNSWTLGDCKHYDPGTASALFDFIAKARDGRGGVMVFASGNYANGLSFGNSEACVRAPGNWEAALTVAAYGLTGRRADYASPGHLVDITAPSSDTEFDFVNRLRIEKFAPVYATSFEGEPANAFGGTSAAAPLVSGVVALMMAANPDIYAHEVVRILEETAIDVGAPGKDLENGFGFLNAYAAVRAALATRIKPAINIALSDASVAIGTPVVLSLTMRNLELSGATVTWQIEGQKTQEGAQVTTQFAAAGEYTVKATATRNGETLAQATAYVLAMDDNNVPVKAWLRDFPHAYPGPWSQEFLVGDSIRFAANPTDEGTRKPAPSYRWLTGDGTTLERWSSTFAYRQPGIYRPRFEIQDSDGASDLLEYALHLYDNPTPPTPGATWQVLGANDEGIVVDFGADKTRAGSTGTVARWWWDFGDGKTANTAFHQHTYAREGVYTVSLTAIDGTGTQATATYDVMVSLGQPNSSESNSSDASSQAAVQPSSSSAVTSSLSSLSAISASSAVSASSRAAQSSSVFSSASSVTVSSARSSSQSSSSAPIDNGDDDKDGVINSNDQCPDTPTGTQVNSRGCKAIVLGRADPVQTLLFSALMLLSWVSRRRKRR
jgi:PKD repeat protein